MGLYFAASYGHRELLNANRDSHLKGNVRYKQNNRAGETGSTKTGGKNHLSFLLWQKKFAIISALFYDVLC